MKWLPLALFFLGGCATVISDGPGHDTGETRRVISVVENITGYPINGKCTAINPCIVTYSPVPSWYGPGVVGYTAIPGRAWVLKDEFHRNSCTDALGHELLHSIKWWQTGDPDAGHTDLKFWKMKLPRDKDSFESKIKEELCK